MNTSEQNFITIIKDALHPQETKSVLLNPVDWDEILSIASRQNLLPFVYDAAMEHDSFSDYDESHSNAFVRTMSVVQVQVQRTSAFIALYRKLQDDGNPPNSVERAVV